MRAICGPTIPVILVGCKSDLRPPAGPQSPMAHLYVQTSAAQEVAREIGARAYKECSALKAEGVDDVFEAATRASMLMREGVSSGAHQRHHRRGSSGKVTASVGEVEKKWGCCVVC